MPRINVYLPQELYERAKKADINVSELCQHAIDRELERRERMRALEELTDELAERFGPATAEEVAEAEAWVDGVLPTRRARKLAPAQARPKTGGVCERGARAGGAVPPRKKKPAVKAR